MNENEIIIIVKGGIVQSVYANDSNVTVGVLDYDNVAAETGLEMLEYYKGLEESLKDMIPVY